MSPFSLCPLRFSERPGCLSGVRLSWGSGTAHLLEPFHDGRYWSHSTGQRWQHVPVRTDGAVEISLLKQKERKQAVVASWKGISSAHQKWWPASVQSTSGGGGTVTGTRVSSGMNMAVAGWGGWTDTSQNVGQGHGLWVSGDPPQRQNHSHANTETLIAYFHPWHVHWWEMPMSG